MATGDVAWESEPFDVYGFLKRNLGTPEWTALLKNSESSLGKAEVQLTGLDNEYPTFVSGKQYKLKITEV